MIWAVKNQSRIVEWRAMETLGVCARVPLDGKTWEVTLDRETWGMSFELSPE